MALTGLAGDGALRPLRLRRPRMYGSCGKVGGVITSPAMKRNKKINLLSGIISIPGLRITMYSEMGDPEDIFWIYGKYTDKLLYFKDLKSMSFKKLKHYATVLRLEERWMREGGKRL